jgi:hypothetical protein
MKFKIDWQRIKSDPLHILWVTGYVLIGGVVLGLLNAGLTRITGSASPHITLIPVPQIVSGGMRIAEGLERFSGHPIVHIWRVEHTFLIASIILGYVVALPIFLWALRERSRWTQGERANRFPLRIALGFGFSGPFVAFSVFLALAGSILSSSVYLSLGRAQTIQSNIDALINDVNLVAMKAQSFYFVSTNDGGGGGRWKNINRESGSEITLKDIELTESPSSRIVGNSFRMERSEFILEVYREDSLAIWGTRNGPGADASFANKNGQRGKIEIHATVTPRNFRISVDNN